MIRSCSAAYQKLFCYVALRQRRRGGAVFIYIYLYMYKRERKAAEEEEEERKGESEGASEREKSQRGRGGLCVYRVCMCAYVCLSCKACQVVSGECLHVSLCVFLCFM